MTERVAAQILDLPFHPAMTYDSVRFVVTALARAVKETA